MARVALLIGIGDYRFDLESIPASSKDAEKFSSVLKSTQWGSFESIQVLTEAELASPVLRSHVAEALENWCHQHQPHDLALLYFSGYLLWNGEEEVFLAAHDTCDEQGNVSRSRAISLRFVRSCLQTSAAQHQTIVIDGCVAERTVNRSRNRSDDQVPLKERSLNLEQHLGGNGRLILAATNHGNYWPEQKQDPLSTYTRFCIDGIRSGLAARNQAGEIMPRDLHNYVKEQMAIATPAITPVLIGDDDLATSLVLSKSPASKSHRDYCDAVKRLLQRHGYEPLRHHLNVSQQSHQQLSLSFGSIDGAEQASDRSSQPSHPPRSPHGQPPLSLHLLAKIQQQLNLRNETTTQLQEVVFRSREQFQQSLQCYQKVATRLMQQELETSIELQKGNQASSQENGSDGNSTVAGYDRDRASSDDLTDEIPSHSRDAAFNWKSPNICPSDDPEDSFRSPDPSQNPLEHISDHNGSAKPSNSSSSTPSTASIRDLSQLEDLRDRLGLTEENVASMNRAIAYVQHLHRLVNYRHIYSRAVQTEDSLDSASQADLAELQHLLHLSDQDVKPIEQEQKARDQIHRQKLEQYRITFSEAMRQDIVQHSWIQDALNHFQHHIGLSDADVEHIETEVQHHMKGSSFSPFNREPEPEPEPQGDDRHQRLQTYRQAYIDAVRMRIPIPPELQTELQRLRQQLHLSEDDVKPIQQDVMQTVRAEVRERFRKLDEYQKAFEQSVEESFPISAEERERLDSLCHSLDLSHEEVKPIEEMVEHQWQFQHRAEMGAPHMPSEQEDEKPQEPSQPYGAQNGLNQDSLEIVEATAPAPEHNGGGATSFSHAQVPETELETSGTAPQSQLSSEQDSATADSSHLSSSQSAPDPLASERDIDYKLLEQQLKNKQWLEADEETRRILVELGKSDSHTSNWLDYRAIAILPATDLHTIDRLWVEHSQGKFGFSVQSNIYFSNDLNSPIVNGNSITFGKQVEWVQLRRGLFGFKFYSQLKFQLLRAPKGHLPAKWFWDIPWWESLRLGGIGTGRGGCGNDDGLLFTFMSKLVNCGVTSHHGRSR